MAGERVKLQVQERDSRGSAESRRLRKQGLIPGVLYGRGKTPHPISIPERELRRVLTGGQGLHAILDVTLEGQKTTHPSILKEYQQHPVKGGIIHVDLQEVRLDQPIQARVVVELLGEPVGVTEGGVLSQVNREITVEALPMEIPGAPRARRQRDGDRRHAAPGRPAGRRRASSSWTIPRRRCSRR